MYYVLWSQPLSPQLINYCHCHHREKTSKCIDYLYDQINK